MKTNYYKGNNKNMQCINSIKIALNRYLRGVKQQLYLQNCEAIWHLLNLPIQLIDIYIDTGVLHLINRL